MNNPYNNDSNEICYPLTPLDWMANANCSNHPDGQQLTNIHNPTAAKTAATQWCMPCPTLNECRTFANEDQTISSGLWGAILITGNKRLDLLPHIDHN